MTKRVAYFIKEHIDLIDTENWKELANRVIEELDTYSDRMRVIYAFRDAGIEPIEDIIWIFIETEALDNIKFYLQDPSDVANSWSRFDWFFEGLTTYDLDRQDVLQHFIDNKERLGLKMTPLNAKYGWYGTPDYDLGWFKKNKFDPGDYE